MYRILLLVVPAIALAGCGGSAEEETQTTVTKNGVTTTTITRRAVDRNDKDGAKDRAAATALSIDADRFKANIEIPGLDVGAEHLDLDGMKLYPGSTVRGVHVHATDHGSDERGEVVLTYSSPAAPAAVARHMADEARGAGYAVTTATAAAVSGAKRDGDEAKSFSMTFAPNGAATVGTLTLTGTGH